VECDEALQIAGPDPNQAAANLQEWNSMPPRKSREGLATLETQEICGFGEGQ
jgi:hypothetical protein